MINLSDKSINIHESVRRLLVNQRTWFSVASTDKSQNTEYSDEIHQAQRAYYLLVENSSFQYSYFSRQIFLPRPKMTASQANKSASSTLIYDEYKAYQVCRGYPLTGLALKNGDGFNSNLVNSFWRRSMPSPCQNLTSESNANKNIIGYFWLGSSLRMNEMLLWSLKSSVLLLSLQKACTARKLIVRI